MAMIYHIATRTSWDAQFSSENYIHDSLDKEGFIHASLASQVEGVIQRYYRDVKGLVKLTIDTELLNDSSLLKYEWAASVEEKFPHIYGSINKTAIVSIDKIT